MQGHLWTETVRNAEDQDEMIWPRILALAERAWHKSNWEENYSTDVENKELEKVFLKIKYYVVC